MTPQELHWLFESKRPKRVFGKGDGAFDEDEAREIYEEAFGSLDDR